MSDISRLIERIYILTTMQAATRELKVFLYVYFRHVYGPKFVRRPVG